MIGDAMCLSSCTKITRLGESGYGTAALSYLCRICPDFTSSPFLLSAV